MAIPEAGTKRVCPESGKKFYDLNKDPIISPYTGESYPLSFFEVEKIEAVKAREKDTPEEKSEADKNDDDEEIVDDAVEIVTLEDADAEVAGDSDVPGIDDDDESEIKLADDDDNTFLETDDDDDDVSDLIVDANDDDDKDI